MEGTPQLLTDVRFSQHRRGYDPDEVDNFLERVSAAVAQLQDKLRLATERAEMADAQLSEARRLQAEAEAAARAGGSVTPGPALDADEELKKVLLLAQRAADQAVNEANTTATKTVADARSKALALLAEAEAERDRMLTMARKTADATAEERAKVLREQVDALEGVKVDLEADVATLEAHLATETERLRAQVEVIKQGLDDPRGLRLAETPPLNDTPVPAPALDDEFDAGPAESSGSPVIDIQEGPDAESGEPGGSDPVVEYGIDDGGATDHETHHDSMALAGPEPTDEPIGEPIGERTEAPDVAIDLTDVEGDEALLADDGGLPTELFTPTAGEASSPLGEPDEAADAAMRAFFEQDLDEDPTATSPRPRFGRRR